MKRYYPVFSTYFLILNHPFADCSMITGTPYISTRSNDPGENVRSPRRARRSHSIVVIVSSVSAGDCRSKAVNAYVESESPGTQLRIA